MNENQNTDDFTTPVSVDAVKNAPLDGPQPGIALCLSGGGYRAMLFHLGALWRLNEVGLLPQLKRISSVSGGSITSGVLGANWTQLDFDDKDVAQRFADQVVAPIRGLASQTIFDRTNLWTTVTSLIEGLFNHDQVAQAYRRFLFGHKTLQDLPGTADDDFTPRFVFNATNLGSGSLWRFSKPYMADWRVGKIVTPKTELAVAVAASSAFPIGLPPVHLPLNPELVEALPGAVLHKPPYTEEAWLVDGGVYDNLGIETAWKAYKMILVSDAGGIIGPESQTSFSGRDPARVFNIIYNQIGSLRRRQVIGSFQLDKQNGEYRDGAYWGIGSDISHYGLTDDQHLPCPIEQTAALANVETVLQRLDDSLQEQLINWGYAICDVALRRHCVESLEAYGIKLTQPSNFPYPEVGVG